MLLPRFLLPHVAVSAAHRGVGSIGSEHSVVYKCCGKKIIFVIEKYFEKAKKYI